MLFFLLRVASLPARLLLGFFFACYDTVLDGLSALGLTSRNTLTSISRREERRWLLNITEMERRDLRHTHKRSRRKRRKLRDPVQRSREFAKTQRFSRGRVVSHLAQMNRLVSGADKAKKAIA